MNQKLKHLSELKIIVGTGEDGLGGRALTGVEQWGPSSLPYDPLLCSWCGGGCTPRAQRGGSGWWWCARAVTGLGRESLHLCRTTVLADSHHHPRRGWVRLCCWWFCFCREDGLMMLVFVLLGSGLSWVNMFCGNEDLH